MTTAWALVSAPKGKLSALTAAVAKELAARRVPLAGFLQARSGAGTEHETQSLVRLSTGEQLELTRPGSSPRAGEEAFCSVVVRPAAFEVARRWLEDDGPRANVWLLDGLSKLESEDRGHAATARWALSQGKLVVLGVRADQLIDVMRVLGLEQEPVAALEGVGDVGSFVDALLR